MSFGAGLSAVPTASLERVLRHLHDGSLEAPITHRSLLAAGLPALVDKLGHLQGLDARAASAVVVAVLAERRSQKGS
jgi:hypothetical protein